MKLLILSGDGIGPEIMQSVLSCLSYLNKKLFLNITIDEEEIGLTRLKKLGSTVSNDFLDRVKKYDGLVLGPLSTLEYPQYGERGINVSSLLRKKLDLYANVRPSFSIEGVSKVQNMDLVIVRENTEGFFADRNMFAGSGEFMPSEDMAFSIRKITADASKRIAKVACELAMQRKKKITVVHKVNTLKLSDGLFLRSVKKICETYSEIQLEEILIDAMAARLIKSPEKFDIVLTTNLFGDILSDEAAELSGSLGMSGSLNFNGNFSVAQAVHGSAPEIAGSNKANPIGLLLSVAMLFQWYSNKYAMPSFLKAHNSLKQGIKKLVYSGKKLTSDLGGNSSTTEFTSALIEQL